MSDLITTAPEEIEALTRVDDPPRPDVNRAASNRFRAAELNRHIGERLRFIRRLSGFSQQHVANEIGLSFQQVQKYENGGNRVSAALLAEFSGLFRLPMDWFIGPYNTCMERDETAGATEYAAIMGLVFRALRDQTDMRCDAALDLICVVAKVRPGRPETRLARLRNVIRANSTEANGLLLELVSRLAEARSNVTGAPRPLAFDKSVAVNNPAGLPHVLLVDDDPDVLRTVSASLTGVGFTVLPARSGDEALAILSSDALIGSVVTDFAMVGMDGVELLVQAERLRPGLPGLVITGYADSGRLRDLPAHIEVLSKPFRRMELIGRLRMMVTDGVKSEGPGKSSPDLKLVT